MKMEGKRSQVLGSPFRVTFLLPNLRAIELKTCPPYLSAVKLWKAGYFGPDGGISASLPQAGLGYNIKQEILRNV